MPGLGLSAGESIDDPERERERERRGCEREQSGKVRMCREEEVGEREGGVS